MFYILNQDIYANAHAFTHEKRLTVKYRTLSFPGIRKYFSRFKLELFAVGMIPRVFKAANMSLITNPQTFLASTK
jgi:hypothetical protein